MVDNPKNNTNKKQILICSTDNLKEGPMQNRRAKFKSSLSFHIVFTIAPIILKKDPMKNRRAKFKKSLFFYIVFTIPVIISKKAQ
jgi:hypothetical protein